MESVGPYGQKLVFLSFLALKLAQKRPKTVAQIFSVSIQTSYMFITPDLVQEDIMTLDLPPLQ